MPLQTYRYAACGGFNTILDIGLFFIIYNYILHGENIVLDTGRIITPHIGSLALSFCITFPVGFYLSRYVVWQQTDNSKREQLLKYLVVVFGCIGLNYMFIKLFVELLNWEATLAKIITTIFVVIFSYFSQKNFTFKA